MKAEFTSLLLITFLAAVVPFLASRMRMVRLPIVVGEILAGMIIGKSGLGLVQPTHALEFLAELGFVFLMFLSGLEMDFDELTRTDHAEQRKSRWRSPLGVASTSFALTVLLALGVGVVLVRLGLARNWLLMGLVLSTTSLGIVVPVLKERGLTASSYGQVLLVTALIGDFVTLLLLSVAIAVLSHGPSVDVLFVLVLLALFVLAVRAGKRLKRVRLFSRTVQELAHATTQIRVRGALALMVAWVVLAEAMGVEIILGAFLAGAIVSLTTRERESPLFEKLDAMGYGFFIPVFFIAVGARFDLRALAVSPTAMVMVGFILVTAFLVKILPALLFRLLFGWRQTVAAGLLLSSRLSLIIAASAIALEKDMITEAANSGLILVAVVTCTAAPIGFTALIRPADVQRRSGAIILGGGATALLLAERLVRAREKVVCIPADPSQLAAMRQAGVEVLEGRADDEEVLRRAGAERASSLLCFLQGPEPKLAACQLARRHFGVPSVITAAGEPRLASVLEGLGVRVVEPARALALVMEGALHAPSVFEVLRDGSYGVELATVVLGQRSLAGRTLMRLQLPPGVKVLGIRRRGRPLEPEPETTLEQGDVLVMAGSPEALLESRQRLEAPS